MAKAKNKRNTGLADKVHTKKKTEAVKKKLNPFEVHINREKIKVLGKKPKHDHGLPGVSRAKALQKRKETLGTEMKVMNKTNAFIDKRIGEKNNHLSTEDRMIARFAAERARQHTKKNIYNLADDEILTHRGQTLEQIEKFDDPRSDDEDEDRGFGGLDDEFVTTNFGGGVLSKTDSKDGAKSHKDLIEQLIAESKKRKAEKQKEKEQTLDLTEKLDSEWKDLHPVVIKKARMEEKEESVIDKLLSQQEKKGEDYDKMMRALIFEKRGTPSDALKSDEKQAKEEKERLEKLEKERQQRMWGEEGQPSKVPDRKHRSADDLADDFDLGDQQDFMLAYDKDGKPLVPDHILNDYSVPKSKEKFEDGVPESSEDDEENDSDDGDNESSDGGVESEIYEQDSNKGDEESKDDLGVDNKKANLPSDLKELKRSKETKKESNDQESSKTNKDKNTSKSSHYSDENNEVSNNESEENRNDYLKVNEKQVEESDSEDESGDYGEEEADGNKDDDNHRVAEKNDLRDLKISDVESEYEENKADSEAISSLFDIKSEVGEKLKSLLSEKNPAQQTAALQKLIKSYDPSLAENNKELLSKLFAHMLQYINYIFTNLQEESDVIKAFLTFDKIAPFFYDLAHLNKVSTKQFLVDLLKEKRDLFRKKHKRIPDMDTLIFFKLISLIYPTSDFHHPVTTPAMLFMTEILSKSKFRDAYSISRGLFLSSLLIEYTALSKKLVPEVINFLRGIFYLCAHTSVLNSIQVVPPFRVHREEKILQINKSCSKTAVENKMVAKDLVLNEINNDFRIRCLLVSCKMTKELFDNFHDIEAQDCLFTPHISLINRIDLELYPKKVSSKVEETLKYMKEVLEMKTYTQLTREKKKPKALRLYEPDVQEVFTGSKSSKLSREQAESERLKHKIKREMKGALREIRRDKAYIASVKIQQKIKSDNIRKQKVKEIYKDAAIQQGELNKLKRSK